jgi:hypothetical protein
MASFVGFGSSYNDFNNFSSEVEALYKKSLAIQLWRVFVRKM